MTRALSAAFGLLMVAAAAVGTDAVGLAVASASGVAVLVSLRFRWAATAAVLGAASCLTLSDATPALCVLAGLAATCFLVLCHAAVPQPFTWTTAMAMLTASAVALLTTAVPARLPWVPLAAPLAVLVLFVLVVQPLRRRVNTAR